MLAYTGLGAAEVAPLWSMSTGGCSGGQFDTYCTPYSGAAGKAYNCVGCSAPNQAQIQTFQTTLSQLVQVFGVQGQFGAGKSVVADKVIGINTARAVGILGALAIQKGLTASPSLLTAITLCNSQRAQLEAKAVTNQGVQLAVQSVAKHLPALSAYFAEALRRFGGQVVTPPTPPVDPTVPVIDMGLAARRRGMMLGGFLVVAIAATTMAFATSSRRRRKP